MLEIYNESLRDLLVESSQSASNRLEILNTQASGCNVPGATQIEVHDGDDVRAIMARGASNRHTSETKMNDRSSRSHQILTVIVDGFSHVTGTRCHGCLHLIDLAGSERVGKSEASGERLIEAQHINKSLSALGDVMSALASKNNHVPFRNSKLTQLLQDSLCGQAKVMMFMHISPEANMQSETVSTLKFATRVSEITLGQAKRNVESGKVFEAHEQVAQLRQVSAIRESQVRELQNVVASERQTISKLQDANTALNREVKELRDMLEARNAMLALRPSQVGTLASLKDAVHSPAATAALKVPRLPLDRTPTRDQDITPDPVVHALLTAALLPQPAQPSRRTTPPLSPLSSARDSSATPRSSINNPVRESFSSSKHIDRLNSARLRQSGVFGTSAAAASFVRGAVVTGQQSVRASNSSYTGLASQRSKNDIAMPMTARVSGVAKTRASDTGGSLTGRKTGVYKQGASSTAPLSSRQQGVFATGTSSRWK
eukprot:jgi/Chrzof1/1486/Cz10g09190.t1